MGRVSSEVVAMLRIRRGARQSELAKHGEERSDDGYKGMVKVSGGEEM